MLYLKNVHFALISSLTLYIGNVSNFILLSKRELGGWTRTYTAFKQHVHGVSSGQNKVGLLKIDKRLGEKKSAYFYLGTPLN